MVCVYNMIEMESKRRMTTTCPLDLYEKELARIENSAEDPLTHNDPRFFRAYKGSNQWMHCRQMCDWIPQCINSY